MSGTCWACEGPVEVFYRLDGIPTGSCVLLHDRAAAQSYPTGDLALAACRTCGFIQNEAFEEGRVDYTSGYEASQAHSPTFRAFVDQLLEGLFSRHDLEGADVVEPGCGQGEFLELLVERTGGRGVGLDPAFDGRQLPDGVSIRPERLTPETTGVEGRLVAARHTLEHIRDVRGFLCGIRNALRPPDVAVALLEVPESLRILHEGAFWDVYYEHASYFTRGSLWRLLDRCGVPPHRIDVAFADQYLIAEAGVGEATKAAPEDRSSIASAVEAFTTAVPTQIERWGNVVADARHPLVWAATSKSVAFMAAVGGVDAVTDINPAKHGSFLAGSGAAVIPPAEVVDLDPDLVVVMNPIYEAEIIADLAAMGLRPVVRSLG